MPKNLEVYQWLVPIIASYYIYRTFRQYVRGKYTIKGTVIWTIFWLGIMALALIPDTIAVSIAKGLGFKDRINAIIFVSLGILFLMVFYLFAELTKLSNKITDLVRRLAIERATDVTKEKKITAPSNEIVKKYVSQKLSAEK